MADFITQELTKEHRRREEERLYEPTSRFGKLMDYVRRPEYMSANLAEFIFTENSPYANPFEAMAAGFMGKRRMDYIRLTGDPILGLALGIALDPLTYIPFKAVTSLVKATRLPKLIGRVSAAAGRRWPALRTVGAALRSTVVDPDAFFKLTSGFNSATDALRMGGVSDDLIRGIKATGSVSDDILKQFPDLHKELKTVARVSKTLTEKAGLTARSNAMKARLMDEYEDMAKWFENLRKTNPEKANAILDVFETAAPTPVVSGGGLAWGMSDEFHKSIKALGVTDDEIAEVLSRIRRPLVDAGSFADVKKAADNVRRIPDHWKMPEYNELMDLALSKLDPEAMELFKRARYVQSQLVDKAIQKQLLSAAVLDNFASELGLAHVPHMAPHNKIKWLQGQIKRLDKQDAIKLRKILGRTHGDKLGLPEGFLQSLDEAGDYDKILKQLESKLNKAAELRKSGVPSEVIGELQKIRKSLMSRRSMAGKLTDIEKTLVETFGKKAKGMYEMNLANIIFEEELRLRNAFMHQHFIHSLLKDYQGTGLISKVEDVIDIEADIARGVKGWDRAKERATKLLDAIARGDEGATKFYDDLVARGAIADDVIKQKRGKAVKAIAQHFLDETETKTVVQETVKATRKQVQAVLKANKDLDLVTDEVLGEFFVHKHLAEPFKRIIKIQTGTSSDWQKLIKMYDKGLGFWKYYTLIPFGKFHTRNLISEMLLNNIAGMWLTDKAYTEAAELLWKVHKKDPDALREYYDLIRKGVIRTGFFSAELGAGKKVITPAWKKFTGLKGMESLGGFTEDMPRIAMYRWATRKAAQNPKWLKKMGFNSVEDVVRKFHPTYDKFTKFEQEAMRRIFPFYSWSRFNLPLHAEMFVQNPKHYATIERTRHALTQLRGGQMPDDIDPEWIKEGYVVGWSRKPGKRTYIVLRGWLPHADLGELLAKRGMQDLVTRQLTPLKVAGEVFWGYNLFEKRSLPTYPGEKTTVLGAKVASRYAHILSPIRMYQEVNRFFFGSEDPYWDRVVYHLFGRAYTIDEEKAKRRLKYDIGKAIGELDFGIKRAKQNQDIGTMRSLEQQKKKLERAVKRL